MTLFIFFPCWAGRVWPDHRRRARGRANIVCNPGPNSGLASLRAVRGDCQALGEDRGAEGQLASCEHQLRTFCDIADVAIVPNERDAAVSPLQPHEVAWLCRRTVLENCDDFAA